MIDKSFNFSEDYSKFSPLLNNIGVTKSEFNIYLNLLSTGPCTKTELANSFKIPRTTIFINIQKLLEKGLVTEIIKNNTKIIEAENPTKLHSLLLRKKIELDENANKLKKSDQDLPELIKAINSGILQTSSDNQIKVKHFLGSSGFREIPKRALENVGSDKEMLFISNIQDWRKVYPREYGRKYLLPERKRADIFLRILAVNNIEGHEYKKEDKNSQRETRILPEQYTFNPSIIISPKEISMFTVRKPYSAIVIENKDMAHFFKNIFENLWEISK